MAYILIILVLIASLYVQWRFKSKFSKYAEIPLNSGLSGKEIAEQMLKDFGISDVQVLHSEGQLTDHYNPAKKTVNLSNDVYFGRSVSAAAVSAHECGHAVQHAKMYAWLGIRSALVPMVSVSSNISQWLILIGIFTIAFTPYILGLGILCFALVTLFSFITLPVEFDASRRANEWLAMQYGVIDGSENEKAKDALHWAAMTYVVAALGSLANLLYYVFMFLGRSRD